MVFGYVRVSTLDQNNESQKNIISRYLADNKMALGEWVEVEISSRKSERKRRIDELLGKLQPGDVVIASELSRLGRSIKEVLSIVEKIISAKQACLVLVKQNLNINPSNQNDMANKGLITMFSMIAELERDFISERTKEALLARKAKGIKLGKPKGTIQKSMYDKDKVKILELFELGVSIKAIIENHLKYGRYQSLRNYIKKIKDLN